MNYELRRLEEKIKNKTKFKIVLRDATNNAIIVDGLEKYYLNTFEHSLNKLATKTLIVILYYKAYRHKLRIYYSYNKDTDTLTLTFKI